MTKKINFKRLVLATTILVLSLASDKLFAQVPGAGIFFQAVARDSYSNPAKDRKIVVETSLIQSTATGTVVLRESFDANTDASGIFSVSIGEGTRLAGTAINLQGVDWSKGPFFLNIKVAIAPIIPQANWDYTKDLVNLGTSPFGAVPYAMFAGSVAGFDTKVNVSDTSKMLLPYAKTQNINALNINKLNVADSTTKYVTPTQLAAKTFDQTPILTSIASKLNIADSITKYVTPTQLASKTFDSTAIYNQLGIKANTASVTTALNTKENVANKSIDVSLDGTSDTKYPSVKAIKTYVDASITANTTPLTFTAPLSKSGFTVSIPQANGSVNGYLNATDWTSFNNKIDASQKAANNGVATLGNDGKIPSNQIPAISFQNVSVVNSSSAMTSIAGAQVGSIAIRTDNNNNYVLSALPSSTLSNWIALATPIYVSTVNGFAGPNVVLTTNDVSEGVNNKYYTDARVRGALSATAPLTFNSSTGAFSIPQASLTADGFLSATDWNIFKNKQNALTAGTDYVTPAQITLSSLGAEATANKSNDVAADASSTTKFPSVKAIKDYVDLQSANAGVADNSITTAKINGAIAINKGGTGATTAAGARTNLGLVIGTDVMAANANTTLTGDVTGSGNGSFATTVNSMGGVSSSTIAGLPTTVASHTTSINTNTTNITTNTNSIATLNTNVAANTASITANASAITNEATTARAAEQTLTSNVAANTASITAETTRATNAENALDTRVTSNTASITNNTADLLLRAPLASPAFTGTPTAPTPVTNDNSTTLATTAYVKNSITAANAGLSSIGAISPTSNAKGATISGTTELILTPADASNGGVVTTGTQTFAGSKTFTNTVTFGTNITINGMNVGRPFNPTSSPSQNTAFGFGVLGKYAPTNWTHDMNSGFGYYALFNLTTGGSNTALGNVALYNLTTGSYNTGYGSDVFPNLTTGSNNTGGGGGAGRSLSTGSDNTMIGLYAGNGITTGSNNIFLGSNNSTSINTGTGITTGSYNTVIGSGIRSLSPTLSNNIVFADGQGNIRAQHNGTTGWTLGTIVSGTWSGTTIGSNVGGAGTVNGLMKANGSGVVSAAVAGTDYQSPLTAGSGISINAGTISATGLTTSNLASNAAITNSQLANSTTTLGSTTMSLGGTVTSVTGLSLVTATNFSGALTGNVTGNATTATTAGNITATSNTSLTSLANLNTVGTITSGTWSATEIAITKGGTSATTAAGALTNLGGEPAVNKSFASDLGNTNPSDILFPTQKAVKTYVDAQVASAGVADGSITNAKLAGSIAASKLIGTDINTVGTITTGVWSGTAIANEKLVNSALTIGSTNVALGATTTTLAGLSTVTSTNFTGNLVGNVTGNVTGNLTGAVTGNASTATALATGRTISTTGDITYTSGSFDGTTNVTGTATLTNTAVTAGSYGSSTAIPTFTVDNKGRLTAAGTVGITAGVSSLNYTTTTSYAAGGTMSGTSLTLTAADATNPGLVSTGTQTFAGAKTFNSDIIVNGIKIGLGSGSLGTNFVFGNGNTLRDNSSGSDNMVFGQSVGMNNTSGVRNLAIGSESFRYNTNGSHNVGVGYFSLRNNSSGSYNIAIGENASQSNTSGNYITTLGYGADVAANNLTNATAIGNGAIVSASNRIQLGNTNVTSVVTSGTISATGFTGPLTGNASTATALATGRTISTTGDITYTSGSFDGSADITGVATLAASGVTSGTYGSSTAIPVLTVDNKGRVTNASTVSIVAGVNTVTAISGTSNANGATINGTSITLTPADATNGGVLTAGAQTIGGAKTFTNIATFNTDIAVNGLSVGRGAGNVASNAALGATALNANTTGNYNVAIGSEALKRNTTGSVNVALGAATIDYLTSGNNNTVIGSFAGRNYGSTAAGTVSTMNNGILLGYDARPLADAGTDEVVIGMRAIGHGSNTVTLGNSSNTKTYVTGDLDVTGNITGATWSGTAIANNKLANSALTIGSTNVALGATTTTLAGLSTVTSSNFTGNLVGNVTGNVTGNLTGAVTGNASTATALATGRTISTTGDITYTSGSFDGTANITGTATLTNTAVTAGSYGTSTAIPTFTVDSKGRLTAASTVSIVAGVNTMTAIAGTSNANGATISGTALTLTPADATNGGIVTTGTQTFVGSKTFSGTTTFNADIVVDGINIGTGANNSGTTNTAIGVNALNSSSVLTDNVAVGYQSLYTGLNAAGYNTAVGSTAGRSITTGNDNSFLGYRAGYNTTTGLRNTAIGSKAMYSGTNVGFSNEAVGYMSLYSNTSGYGNSAMGDSALSLNTTGYYNVGIGHQAMSSNTTGNNNIGLGYLSLGSNTTGNQNIGIGRVALYNNGAGINNIAIGYEALSFNGLSGTYSNNIAIGKGAGKYYASYNQPANNLADNIFIGVDAWALTTSDVNSIVIGNNVSTDNGAVGWGSYSTSIGNTLTQKSRIYGALTVVPNTATGVGNSSTIAAQNGGTNFAGGALNLTAGNGNGTGNGGNINLTPGTTGTGTAGKVIVNGGDMTVNGVTVGKGTGNGTTNTTIGTEAMLSNTGGDNTAVGWRSLYSNTSGASNAAFGTGTMLANTTGKYNTALGYNTLYMNNANNNTGIGYNTMYYNDAGIYNTAVGGWSAYYNQSGNNNTSLGYRSLYANTATSSSDNTAIGYSALSSNASGGTNTALGSNAGLFITTGAGNTGVGNRSLYYSTTGNYNTALGNSSGPANSTNISTNGIFIGYNAKSSAGTSITDETVIGANTTGNGSNTVTIGNAANTANYLRGTTNINTGTLTSTTGVNLTGSVNDFLQYNVQNSNTGTSAQSGFNAMANNGNDAVNFAWMGINNSTFNNPQTYNVGGINDVSFLGGGNDMYVANSNNYKSIIFSTGTATTPYFAEKMRLTNSGTLAIGTTGATAVDTVNAKLHVAGKVKIVDGNQAVTKVLTSDANGLATWQNNGGSVATMSATGNATTTANYIIFTGSTASQIITIPSAVTVGAGREITIKNVASVSVSIASAGGNLIQDNSTLTATSASLGIEPSNNWMKLMSDGTNWYIIRALF